MIKLGKKFRVLLRHHLRKSASGSLKTIRPHEILFLSLIVLLPIQLGKHYWFEWSNVLGLPVDYLSPTLYLTDILVVAIIAIWFWEKRSNYTLYAICHTLKIYWLVGAVFLFLLVNSFLAANQGVAFYKFIKIIEFSLLGFYIAKNDYTLYAIRCTLPFAVIYSALIAIAQFVKQASLGGPFWWLGERTFSIATPGIAKATVGGQLVLRPYATFSHPNVLAGFILASLILVGSEIGDTRYVIRKMARWLALILGSIAILLSFSRSAWLTGLIIGLWVVGCGLWRRTKSHPRRKQPQTPRRWSQKIAISWHLRGGAILAIALVCVLAFFFLTQNLSGQEAFDQRLALAAVAIEMFKTHPLAGVGLNNFIPQLPHYWHQFGQTYWLQPVHNFFLLVAAETGLVGLLLFLWLLMLTYGKLLRTKNPPKVLKTFRRVNQQLLLLLTVILALGLADHYWLTLQQTQLLLTIILGLSWRPTFVDKKL